jgi:hypothetical protein
MVGMMLAHPLRVVLRPAWLLRLDGRSNITLPFWYSRQTPASLEECRRLPDDPAGHSIADFMGESQSRSGMGRVIRIACVLENLYPLSDTQSG